MGGFLSGFAFLRTVAVFQWSEVSLARSCNINVVKMLGSYPDAPTKFWV